MYSQFHYNLELSSQAHLSLHKNKTSLMVDPSHTENQYGSASKIISKCHIGSLKHVPFAYKSLVGLSQQINNIS